MTRAEAKARCAQRYAEFLHASRPGADIGRSAAAEELAELIAAAPARCKRNLNSLLLTVADWDEAWCAAGANGTRPLVCLGELLFAWRPRVPRAVPPAVPPADNETF